MMWQTNRRVTLDLAMMGWGMGTWLGVNGLFVQLPLLVARAPEGWALPSSMVLAVQLANVGVILYGLAKRFLPRLRDAIYIYALLTVGTIAMTLNAFLHEETATVAGTERSVAFITLTFFVALVGCTSSVLFYPYLRYYRDVYLATYLVGEGLSGFLPSILALIQGVGGDPECIVLPDGSVEAVQSPPLFSSLVFLLVVAALFAISLICFTFVDRWAGFLTERVKPEKDHEEVTDVVDSKSTRESLLSARWIGVLVFMAGLNALMNGVLPSVQSYSCMPYGSRAYHLAVTLGAMANPVACLAGVWLRPLPPRWLGAMLGTAMVPLGYILTTALLSPTPPLQTEPLGEALVIISWVSLVGVLSYSRMWVYGWARGGGARGMRACGAVTQAGSATGSAVLFFIVNFTGIFTQPDACPVI